jgi:hypothetical protein
LSLDDFIAWRRRSLAAVGAEENAIAARYEAMAPEPVRPIPEGPRIVADRVFERPEAEAAE